MSNDILIGYDDFMSTPGNEIELSYIIDKMEEYSRRLTDTKSRRVKINNLETQLAPYLGVDEKFSDFKDTQFTRCAFGTLSDAALAQLKDYLSVQPLAALEVFTEGQQCAVLVVAHAECAEEIFKNSTNFPLSNVRFPTI